MNKDRRGSKYRKKMILLGGTIIIISSVIFGVYSTTFFSSKKEEALAKGEGNKDFREDNNIVNNYEYLPLDADHNADDALEISEYTAGIITGRKSYPVRSDGKKVVYLTFDDGPSTTNTEKILDILKEYNIKGTFFVLGKNLENNKEGEKIIKKIASDGHALGNHSYGHDYNYLYPEGIIDKENFIKDYDKTNDMLKNILGEDFYSRVLRFPGGYWSWEGREKIKPILNERGIANIDWNALNGDAESSENLSAEELVNKTKKSTESLGKEADNIVLLMHDTYGKENTVKALPEIIKYYKDKGFEFRTIK